MSKTKIIFIAALVLLVLFTNVIADDKELNIGRIGDDELWISTFGDEEAGQGIITKPEDEILPAGGAGGGSGGSSIEGEKLKSEEIFEEITWGLGYIWDKLKYLFNTRFREWMNIGKILSPSNPAMGWFIFALIIYGIWTLLVSLPILIRREIKRGAPSTIKIGIFILIAIFGFAVIWMQRNVLEREMAFIITQPKR